MLSLTTAPCSRCEGSGWIPLEGTLHVTPCDCQPELRRKQRLQAACLPKRYVHCTLDGFKERNNASLRNAKKRAEEFVDCWPGTNRGMLLMGGCGVGKTHLAVAVLQEIIASGKAGRLLFSNFQDLIQQIQASFESDQVPSKSEILRPLLEADLLVLDELGSQKPTLFVQDTLYYVINSRYNEEKTTIFTTNYADEAAEARDENLEQRISKRLRSRLYEMTDRVPIDSKDDYRKSII